MPDEKKNYSGLLISIGGAIGLLLFLLNYCFSNNNSSSLEKQEEIVNLQEENKIADEEIINKVITLDNIIINLIIFFLIFAIAVYFVYFSPLSPVVRNNSKNIKTEEEKKIKEEIKEENNNQKIENNQEKKDVNIEKTKKNNTNESFFRRKILFKENRKKFLSKKKTFYYLCDHGELEKNLFKDENDPNDPIDKNKKISELNNEEIKKVKFNYFQIEETEKKKNEEKEKNGEKEKNKVKEDKEEINFQIRIGENGVFDSEKYFNEIIKCYCEEVIGYNKGDKKESSSGKKKEEYINNFFKNKNKIIEYNLNNESDQKNAFFKEICQNNINANATYERYFDHFLGEVIFFNKSNIFASLYSFGLFFLSLEAPLFVIYFFYALIDAFLEEIEENKFLFALCKALGAITFLNFRSFHKIIPILCLSGVLIFDGYLFFGKSTKLNPEIYNDAARANMKIYDKKLLGELLEKGEVDIPIDEYDFEYIPEDIPSEPLKNKQTGEADSSS